MYPTWCRGDVKRLSPESFGVGGPVVHGPASARLVYFRHDPYAVTSPIVADVPCMRRPVRKILPAPQTTIRTVPAIMATDATHLPTVGGPRACRGDASASSGMGAGRGNQRPARSNVMRTGARSTVADVNTGNIISSITVVHHGSGSLSVSLQAHAPESPRTSTRRMKSAITRNSRNHQPTTAPA
jgi:hypothetical protein